MIQFLCGCLVGGIAGAVVMALCVISSKNNREDNGVYK